MAAVLANSNKHICLHSLIDCFVFQIFSYCTNFQKEEESSKTELIHL